MDDQLRDKIASYVIEAIQDPGRYLQHDNYVDVIKKEVDSLIKVSKPTISNLTVEFLEWQDKKMFTHMGMKDGKWQELEGWYNVPNPDKSKKLLSTEELFELFLLDRET